MGPFLPINPSHCLKSVRDEISANFDTKTHDSWLLQRELLCTNCFVLTSLFFVFVESREHGWSEEIAMFPE